MGGMGGANMGRIGLMRPKKVHLEMLENEKKSNIIPVNGNVTGSNPQASCCIQPPLPDVQQQASDQGSSLRLVHAAP